MKEIGDEGEKLKKELEGLGDDVRKQLQGLFSRMSAIEVSTL